MATFPPSSQKPRDARVATGEYVSILRGKGLHELGTKMTAAFQVTYGEFESENSNGGKVITKSCLNEFWRKTENGNRRGVYVFGIRAAKGWKPLYVGQTKKQTFRKRIGQHTKVDGDFDEMLSGIKKATPVLFLVARVGKGRNSNSVIDDLEVDFINYAFARNKYLHNDRGIKKPTYQIQGFQGPGKPAKRVADLKLMIGY